MWREKQGRERRGHYFSIISCGGNILNLEPFIYFFVCTREEVQQFPTKKKPFRHLSKCWLIAPVGKNIESGNAHVHGGGGSLLAGVQEPRAQRWCVWWPCHSSDLGGLTSPSLPPQGEMLGLRQHVLALCVGVGWPVPYSSNGGTTARTHIDFDVQQ